MEFRRHTCRALHEDHAATTALLQRLETLLGRHSMDRPPGQADADTTRFVKDLIHAVAAEIGPHFAFEEEAVFPVLAEAGEREMGDFLTSEHRVILPLAERLAELARLARDTGFDAGAWAQFHEVGAALAEHLASHILKEDMGLLPALDDALDDETDGRLAVDFAARR